MTEIKRGKFIVLEGIDGSGKSTLINGLYNKMKELSLPCEKTFEPTNGEIGKLIRAAFRREITLSEKAIAALFLADRLDHIQNPDTGMLTSLDKGNHIICDRYIFSSYAYHVPHVTLEWVINANSVCTNLLMPDLIIYLDIPVALSLERLNSSRNQLEIFETEERLKQVYHNYENALAAFSDANYKIQRIDASLNPELVLEHAWQHILKILNYNY